MGAQPNLRWDPPDYEPDYEPDIRELDEERPRDAVVDQAKDAIRAFSSASERMFSINSNSK